MKIDNKILLIHKKQKHFKYDKYNRIKNKFIIKDWKDVNTNCICNNCSKKHLIDSGISNIPPICSKCGRIKHTYCMNGYYKHMKKMFGINRYMIFPKLIRIKKHLSITKKIWK